METKLRELLTNFHYTSSVGRGERKLMSHHIDALMKDLVPFIEQQYDDGYENCAIIHGLETEGY